MKSIVHLSFATDVFVRAMPKIYHTWTPAQNEFRSLSSDCEAGRFGSVLAFFFSYVALSHFWYEHVFATDHETWSCSTSDLGCAIYTLWKPQPSLATVRTYEPSNLTRYRPQRTACQQLAKCWRSKVNQSLARKRRSTLHADSTAIYELDGD